MSGTFFSLCRFLLFLFRGAVRVDAKNTTISTIRLERWVDFASRFQNLHLLCRAVLRRREEPIHATPNAEQRVVSSWSGALRSVNQRSPARCLGFPFFRWLKMRLEEVVGAPLGLGNVGIITSWSARRPAIWYQRRRTPFCVLTEPRLQPPLEASHRAPDAPTRLRPDQRPEKSL